LKKNKVQIDKFYWLFASFLFLSVVVIVFIVVVVAFVVVQFNTLFKAFCRASGRKLLRLPAKLGFHFRDKNVDL